MSRNQPVARSAACAVLLLGAASAAGFGFGLVPQAWTAGIAVVSGLACAAGAGLIALRLKEVSALAEAVRVAAGGERDSCMLLVDERAGELGRAWNELVTRDGAFSGERSKFDSDQRGDDRGSADGMLAACDAMWQGVVLVNRACDIVYANGASAVFLGVDRAELVGSDLCEVIGDASVADAVREVAEGKVRRRKILEVDSTLAESSRRVLRFGIRPVRREDEGIAIVQIEDITQQRIAEESRQSFVAQATHELRSPLTNIRLYLESAMDEAASTPTERAEALSVINAESLRLERVVSDMLCVSEMDAGSMGISRDDVRLDALFRDIEAANAPAARAKHQKLSFDLPPKLPVMLGDRDKIASALQNLVGNAIKYTPDEGRIDVQVVVDGSWIAIDVADDGIGIAEEEHDRVFERFYRSADERLVGIEGSGLGLGLARQIARLHGGDITIESSVGSGSTFTLRMPLGDEGAMAAAA